MAFTPYEGKYVAGTTQVPSIGEFYLDSNNAKEKIAVAQGISGQGYEFVFWQYYYSNEQEPVYKELNSSVVINQNITFVANFQEKGEVAYNVVYKYETLQSAKVYKSQAPDYSEREYATITQFKDSTSEYYAPTDPICDNNDPSFRGTAKANSDIYVNKSSIVGFDYEQVSTDNCTYDSETRDCTISESEGTVTVKMNRKTEFDYRVSYWAETAESAIAHKDEPDPTAFGLDRTYEDSWDQRDEYPNPRDDAPAGYTGHYYDFKGVYGDVVYV